MAKGKQPYIPLYTGDWIKSTRPLTLAAKGAWIDLISFMWEAPEKGVLVGTHTTFARMIGTSTENFASILLELCLHQICDIDGNPEPPPPGQPEIAFKIICRRIVRDAEISAKRAISGSKGGSKTQANIKQTASKIEAKRQAKNKQIPEYEYEYDNEYEDENITDKESENLNDFESVRAALFGDDLWMEGIKMTHPGLNYEQALKECYLHHSQTPRPPVFLWQWRQKFNTWCSIKSTSTSKTNGNKSKSKDQHTRRLAESFASRYGA